MKNKKAFTLVELLVVISIIALLLAILMPSLNEARRQAQQIVCLNNSRQNVIPLIMYANENNDSFTRGHDGWDGLYTDADDPPGGDMPTDGFGYWMSDIKPYRGEDIKSLVCVAVKKMNPNFEHSGPNTGNNEFTGWKNYSGAWNWSMEGLNDDILPIPISYTMAIWATNPQKGSIIEQENKTDSGLTAPYSYCWRKINKVSNASQVPIIGDGRWLEAPVVSPTPRSAEFRFGDAVIIPPTNEQDAEDFRASASYNWGLGQYVMQRHGKSINLTFADSSARKVPLYELWKLKWNKYFDTSNDFANGTESFPKWIK